MISIGQIIYIYTKILRSIYFYFLILKDCGSLDISEVMYYVESALRNSINLSEVAHSDTI